MERLFPSALALGLLTACGEPHGTQRLLEEAGCAEGWLADGETCIPETCGTGTWGDLPVDGTTVHVDAAAPEGGDGGAEAPLRAIQPALDLAAARHGGMVAVAAGTYPETLVLTSDHAEVHLAGRCRELVILDASVGDESTAGIAIDSRYGDVQLSRLTVHGSLKEGIRIESGAVELRDVAVENCAYIGVMAYRSATPTPTVTAQRCTLAGNGMAGVAALGTGTQVELSDTTITNSTTNEHQVPGVGIAAYEGASLSASGCVLSGNQGSGIAITDPGTRVELVGTTIRDTRTDEQGLYGYGISVIEGASIFVDGCELVGNSGAGLIAFDPGSEATMKNTTVRDTRPHGVGLGAVGVGANDGVKLGIEHCELVGNASTGIAASGVGTEATLVDTTVQDTWADEDNAGGAGVLVSQGATLSATGCELSGNTAAGISTVGSGTQVSLSDTRITSTLPELSGEYGYGVNVNTSATLAAVGCEITGNAAVGVLAHEEGTEVSLEDTVIRDTRISGSGRAGFGINVYAGATLRVRACEISDNVAAGLVAGDPGTVVTLHDSTISNTAAVAWATATALAAQEGGVVEATGLRVLGNDGPGLYAHGSGAHLSCTSCSLHRNRFAGAVVIEGGSLELISSSLTSTSESVDLGGGVGIYAAQQGELRGPALLVTDSTIAYNPTAGAWIAGEGSFQLEGNRFHGSAGIAHGSGSRCGDGVYAASAAAWTGRSGLRLAGNTISDNTGAGLFLNDAEAALEGNTWAMNHPDLLVQGEACFTPRGDYGEAPEREICPEWDLPTCDMDFRLDLGIEDLESARLAPLPAPAAPPPRLLTGELQLSPAPDGGSAEGHATQPTPTTPVRSWSTVPR